MIVTALLDVRRHHPTWDAKKLLKVVSTRQPTWTLPARSTVCDLLDRAGLVTARRREGRARASGALLIPMTAANGVGLEEVGDGLWDVYFGPVKLGRLDERRRQIEDHKGRFIRKTMSPMSPD